jgi:S-(hydroxymethyl)glutathione dehydrogenase/alcohol dehydrogenase
VVWAAVLGEVGGALELREIDLPEPGPGQVRVRMAAAGVCHSDLSLSNGTLKQPTPVVLGHEGAGVVVATGEGVTRAKPGDHVVLNWLPSCGECWFCRQGENYLCERSDAADHPYATLADGTPVYPGLGTAAFAEETVVSERAVVPIPPELPLDQAAVLGCAMLTGAGAVFNTAGVLPGQSVAVFGLGGVGLSVLQAARLAGASQIVAVDLNEDKRELAHQHGATDFVPYTDAAPKAVRQLVAGRGVDHAFDCVGRTATIRAAWGSSRRGGAVTVVGIGPKTEKVEFSAMELYWFGRTLRGCVYGSSIPDDDVPHLVQHALAGELDLGALITGSTDLAGVDAALKGLANAQGARTVVRF